VLLFVPDVSSPSADVVSSAVGSDVDSESLIRSLPISSFPRHCHVLRLNFRPLAPSRLSVFGTMPGTGAGRRTDAQTDTRPLGREEEGREVRLQQLSKVRLQHLVGHPEPIPRIEHLLRREEAVLTIQVADRPGRLG
jgi:hypothetical protein